eukprot:337403_1
MIISQRLKCEGNQLLKQGHHEQALAKYNKAIELYPRDQTLYANRAAAYTYLNLYEQAADDARHSTEIDPNYVTGYVREGIAEYKLEHYETAHMAYSNAMGRTDREDSTWHLYHEKAELCRTKMTQRDGTHESDDGSECQIKVELEGDPDFLSPQHMKRMEHQQNLMDDIKTEEMMKLDDDHHIKGDLSKPDSFNSFYDFYSASMLNQYFDHSKKPIPEQHTRTKHDIFLEAIHGFNMETAKSIKVYVSTIDLISIGIDGCFLVILEEDCYLFERNVGYHWIGMPPKVKQGWVMNGYPHRHIVPTDKYYYNGIVSFIYYVSQTPLRGPANINCHVMSFDLKTRKIEWNPIGSNNEKKIKENNLFPIVPLHFNSEGGAFSLIDDTRILMMDSCRNKSIFVVDISTLNVTETEDAFPFEFRDPLIIPITANSQRVKNKYLILCHSFTDAANVAFELYMDGCTVMSLKQIEVRFRGRFLDGIPMNRLSHFVFNDHLIVVDCGGHKDISYCYLFSFDKMEWIADFRLRNVCYLQSPDILINHGTVHIIHENGHYYLDIGNRFNYRNQVFYAILDGIQHQMMNCSGSDMDKNDIIENIFDFVDDGLIVQHLEKPYKSHRHTLWIYFKSLIICNSSYIAYKHTLDFMKTLFDLIDPISISDHHLPKPWIDSYHVLMENMVKRSTIATKNCTKGTLDGFKDNSSSKRVRKQCYHCKRKKSKALTLRLCSQCRKVRFCGRKCQKVSWNKKHRYQCI